MDLRANDIANAADNTCQWLLTHSNYVEWLQSKSSLLWIKGKPGAGKSTLMKYALRQEGRDQTVIASFFFNARGSPLERTPIGLYRSLLHQLLRFAPDQLSKLAAIYKERCQLRGEVEMKWNWHEGELKDWLSDLLLTLAVRPVRLYIDALDESGEAVATQLVEYCQSLVKKAFCAGNFLYICFSCRHYPIIATLDGFTICVENENSTDIKAYVQQRLEANSIEQRKAQLLSEEILKRAHGAFQWITLVIPRVLRECKCGKRIDTIQSNIRKLPPELHNLYGMILTEISDDERFESLKLMRWICFAFKPLSLREIRHAMAVDISTSYTTLQECTNTESYVETDEDMEKRVIDLSKGLAEVQVHRRRNFVQLIHESVKDFLVQDGLQRLEMNSPGTAIGRAHLHLAWTCVRYLGIFSAEKGDLDTNESISYNKQKLAYTYPLIHYSTVSWVAHALQVEEERLLQEDLFRLFQQLYHPYDYRRKHWLQLYRTFESLAYLGGNLRLARNPTLLHVIAMHGLRNVLSAFLNLQDVELDSMDDNGRTPLSLAAEGGHEAVVKLLVGSRDRARGGGELLLGRDAV